MARDLNGRVDRLEQQRPDPGCPTCRAWPAVLTTREDGTPPSDSHPACCPTCGRVRRVYVREPAHSFDYAAFEHTFREAAADIGNFADRWLQEQIHHDPA